MVQMYLAAGLYLTILVFVSIMIYFIFKWRRGRPIYGGLKADNIWKAFVLNSIASAIVILVAITTKKEFDAHFNQDTKKDGTQEITNVVSTMLTLLSTFVTSMLAFTVMYVLFGFGGGMLAPIGDPERV